MRKMDEMEMNINLKAIHWSWFITAVALFVWVVYEFVKTHTFSIAFDILILQSIIYLLVTQISKWKMGDENGRKSFVWSVIGFVFFILLFGVLSILFPLINK